VTIPSLIEPPKNPNSEDRTIDLTAGVSAIDRLADLGE